MCNSSQAPPRNEQAPPQLEGLASDYACPSRGPAGVWPSGPPLVRAPTTRMPNSPQMQVLDGAGPAPRQPAQHTQVDRADLHRHLPRPLPGRRHLVLRALEVRLPATTRDLRAPRRVECAYIGSHHRYEVSAATPLCLRTLRPTESWDSPLLSYAESSFISWTGQISKLIVFLSLP